MSAEVWIGRVEVAPVEGNDIFEGDPGAFSNAFVQAESLDQYTDRVTVAFAQEGLDVVGIEGAEPLRERMARVEVSDELVRVAEEALGGDVVWDTFYVFENDDDS
jgi:hypothetical protein